MKDEIKEIKLDHFKDLEELKQNVENWIATDEMYWERWFGLYDIKALLDCITNLQEEYEDLKIDNKRLQHNEKVFKSRNEKAIKLLKEAGCYDEKTNTFCDDVWEELPELLNILQGENNTPENLYKYTPEKGFRLVGDENEESII